MRCRSAPAGRSGSSPRPRIRPSPRSSRHRRRDAHGVKPAVREAGADAHQPEQAEGQHEQAGGAPHRRPLQPRPQRGAGDAHREQQGQRSEAEGEHDQRALGGGSGEQRRHQHAVHHAAGNPAPQPAQRQRLPRASHGKQAPHQRLHATPGRLAERLDARQSVPDIHQRQAERNEHQVGHPVGSGLHRCQIDQGRHAADEAGEGAGQRIAGDPAGVEGDHARATVGSGSEQAAGRGDGRGEGASARSGDGEGADDAAAHADAMYPAEQADQEYRQEGDGTQWVNSDRARIAQRFGL